MIRRTLKEWSTRRWIAVIGSTPVLAAAFVILAGSPLGDPSGGWFTLMSFAAILSAGVLGSYVPQEGFRPDLGCAPCAFVPVSTVVGAMIAVGTSGADLIGPAIAIALTSFGLAQRLSNVSNCDVPAEPRAGEHIPEPLRTMEQPGERGRSRGVTSTTRGRR